MRTSRRQFLKAGAFIGGFATLYFAASHTTFAQQSPSKVTQEPKTFLRDDFDRCLNTQFQVFVDGLSLLKMKFVEVAASNSNCECCFTLVFRALDGTALRQNTFTIKHNKMGTFKMFMVPGEDGHGLYYVAVFNRLHQ